MLSTKSEVLFPGSFILPCIRWREERTGYKALPENRDSLDFNQMPTNYFQVCGNCERDIFRFMREIRAKDTVIEYGWQECLIGDEHLALNSFIGFGYCELTSLRLSRLADFHELQLVFLEPVVSDSV